MDCSTPGFLVDHQLLELTQLMSIKLVMPSNHLILCCPLLLLPSIFPSIRAFPNESVLCIRWLEYWSFSLSQSFQWTFRTDFLLDWLVGSPRSLGNSQESTPTPQFKSNTDALFIVQLSQPNMTTGKTIALTRRAFVDKVMPLLFNMLSRLVIAFLPRRKRLLVSWL